MRSARGPVLFLIGLGLAALLRSPTILPAPGLREFAAERPPVRVEAGACSARSAIVSFLEKRPTALLPAEIRAVAATVCRESARAGLSPDLVMAVIDVESSGYNFAVSPAGALGLMQVLPGTGAAMARELGMSWRGPATLVDPVANVRIGIHYLARLIRRFGSVQRALAAYNWGPTRIAARIGRGEVVPAVYARRVMDVRAENRSATAVLPRG